MFADIKRIEAEWRARMHKALSFDGVDDYVEIANPLPITNQITIISLIKLIEHKEEWYVVDERTDKYRLGVDYYDMVTWVTKVDNTGDMLSLDNVFTEDKVGQWIQCGAVHDASVGIKRIFINGEVVAEKTNAPVGLFTDLGKTAIGRWWGSLAYNIPGYIAHVSIYNRALSESEIKYLYHNPFDPIDPDHLVLWLNPAGIDVANSKWWDLSGKGNHGTIHGATEVKLVEDEVIVK